MYTLSQMVAFADNRRSAVLQLLVVAALMAVSYLCIRTLRFTNDGLDVAFVCLFFLLPFLAIRPVLRLRRWPKVAAANFLVPLLTLSLLCLLFTVTCDIPAVVERRELRRELGSVRQGHY